MDNQSQVGPPSEKTEQNIRRARSHSVWIGPVHIEYKLWTGGFRLWPAWDVMTTEFWNEGPVRWWRGYWLCFGLSIYRLLEDRRMQSDGSYVIYHRDRRG
jgi:hypothetical protein